MFTDSRIDIGAEMPRTIASIVFGTVGLLAFLHGRKHKSWRPMVTGVAMMAYPYFFTGVVEIFLVGTGLAAVLYFWRE